jgi:peptidoglycan/LPS O-acetylase OafA/YrhL
LPWKVLSLTTVALFALSSLPGDFWRYIVLPCALCSLLCFLLCAENKLKKFPYLGWLDRLGEWSYGMYLIHAVTIIFVLDLSRGRLGGAEAWLSAIAAALFMSALIGHADVWLHNRMKRSSRRALSIPLGETAGITPK